MKMMRSLLAASSLFVFSFFCSSLPAIATSTRVIETRCIWSGDDGELTQQNCKIYGSSSTGSGESFHIVWEDGVKTIISRDPSSQNYYHFDTKKPANIYGSYTFGRMSMPRQIVLEDLGIIVVDYRNYRIFRQN